MPKPTTSKQPGTSSAAKQPTTSSSSGPPNKWGALSSTVKATTVLSNRHRSIELDPELHQLQLKQFEDELMGHKEGEGQIGDSIERNMNQMVDVLRSKINAMGNAAKTRIRLCEEDLKKNSKESSDQAPKIMEDFDESSNMNKGTKDHKNGFVSHKDNLVSAEGVYIDAAHLVIRTKAPTDAAKKLELELEESFALSNLKDMKKMRGKTGMSRTEKSKKSEQKRFEAKKVLRNKSEKDLQTNMENFLTRSVMDSDLVFKSPSLLQEKGLLRRRSSVKKSMQGVMKALESTDTEFENEVSTEDNLKDPEEGEVLNEDDYMDGFDEQIESLDPVHWPITIKWPLKDHRSAHPDNAEGEMDPALLLRYSVEKINLPSGENMFRWLVRQSTILQYFVYLFWLIKVKFFEKDSDPENESFLLKGLSIEYIKIIELLASHGHGAEYEKDFAYQYLPYILANAVYFGFFFLCPGSRHIYTKGFKKTILLQVVKVMHGIQLCTASVKVLWLKLFPEDTHEVEDDVEDVAEIFPVQIAVGNEAKYLNHTLQYQLEEKDSVRSSSIESHMAGWGTNATSGMPLRFSGQLAGEDNDDRHYRGSNSSTSNNSRAESQPIEREMTPNGHKRRSLNRKKSDHSLESANPKPTDFSADMQNQWNDRATSLRLSYKNGKSATLQGQLKRRSSFSGTFTIPPLPPHLEKDGEVEKKRERSETCSVYSESSSGTRNFNGPRGIPTISTILQSSAAYTARRGSPKKSRGGSPARGLSPGISGYRRDTLHSRGKSPMGLNTTRETLESRGKSPLGNIMQSFDDFKPHSADSRGQKGSPTLGREKESENPLSRTLLKSNSLRYGHKITGLSRRQATETVNMKGISPLMQEYFVSSVLAPVKMAIGAQMMRRTVPVSWCAAGGADTHRRRIVHTEVHQDMIDKRKESEKEFLKTSFLNEKQRIESIHQINKSCSTVLKSDAATIGRFSLDLVKRQQLQRKTRASGVKGEFAHAPPIEAPSSDLLSASDALLAANFDPDELDEFLANI